MEENRKSEVNGLKLIELGSKAETLKDLNKEKLNSVIKTNFVNKSNIVVWMDYKVLIGTCDGGRPHFHKDEQFEYKYVQRLRVFDQQKELLVWRNNGKWKGRLRMDNFSGTGTIIVLTHQLLFGTSATPLDAQFTEISERRGTILILPFSNINVDNNRQRVFIKTHNYIKFNAAHQATYCDCRFVGFTDGEKEF